MVVFKNRAPLAITALDSVLRGAAPSSDLEEFVKRRQAFQCRAKTAADLLSGTRCANKARSAKLPSPWIAAFDTRRRSAMIWLMTRAYGEPFAFPALWVALSQSSK